MMWEKNRFWLLICKRKGLYKKGDARNLDFVTDERIDLICTHLPYADIIKYSNGIDGDLSQLKVKDFLEEMEKVAEESYPVLLKGQVLCYTNGWYSTKRTYDTNVFWGNAYFWRCRI